MNRSALVLLGLEAFLGLTLWMYLTKFPFLPEYQSVDFIQYVRIVKGYQMGQFGGLQFNLLYGDVLFYLDWFGNVFGGSQLIVVERYAMGLLVLASPLIVYGSVRAMVESRDWALVSTAFYTLGGYLWFSMVFNSGLYANFVGVLASLALAGATVWATRGAFDPRKLGVWGLLLVFALFSHYSTLLLFPSLFVYLAYVAFKTPERRKSALSVLALLAAPLVAGAALYSGLLLTMLGFLSANSGGVPSTDDFSAALLVFPVLGYMIAELTFDVGAVVMLALAASAVFLAWKKRDGRLLMPVTWLVTILVTSPFNASAWRFAFVALVPLTLLAAHPLALLFQTQRLKLGLKARNLPRARRIVVVPIIFLVVSGGWVFRPVVPFGAFSNATTDIGTISDLQGQTMAALAWMKNGTWGTCGFNSIALDGKAHASPANLGKTIMAGNSVARNLGNAKPCSFLDVTDWHFIYSQDLGGPAVEYDPTYSSPDSASFHALTQRESYLIVTNVTSFEQQPCQSTSLVTLTVKDYSSTGAKLLIHLFSTEQTLSKAALYVNGKLQGTSEMVNNSATANIEFTKPGTYTVQGQVGNVYSNSERFVIGLGPIPAPVNVPASTTGCQPWSWSSDDLGGATLAWNSSMVHIWNLRA